MSDPIPPPNSPSPPDELYVGYLPVPPSYRRFLRAGVPLVLVAFVAGAALWGTSYRSPGNAVWDTAQERSFAGIMDTSPYAAIRVVDDAVPGGVRTLLLVQEGKHGASAAAQPLSGRAVRVRGHILERDGRQLLELAGEPEPWTAAPPETSTRLGRPAPVSLGRVTLTGEIIDPKCYFGAMKPGEGKTHKACATLCIAGGIPPMFLTRDAKGQKVYYLLADQDGGPANEHVLPYVGDPLEIAGAAERVGDVLVLKLDPASMRRL